MFNSHLQINVIRSPIGDFSCFSPLTSVLTSYPWTPKTAIAWTGLEEGRFFDLSFSRDNVTNPNVAMLRLNRAPEGAHVGAASNTQRGFEAASGHIMSSSSTNHTNNRYKESGSVEPNIIDKSNNKMVPPLGQNMHGYYTPSQGHSGYENNYFNQHISPNINIINNINISPNSNSSPSKTTKNNSLVLPTPDTTLQSEESDETEYDHNGEQDLDIEEYMSSANRVREMYAKSYPNIQLPPITQEDVYSFHRGDSHDATSASSVSSSCPSPTPSPTLPSLTSVLGDLIPHKDDSADDEAYSPSELSGNDSNYSPGSIQSSPEDIYYRGKRGTADVIYQHNVTVDAPQHSYTCHRSTSGSIPQLHSSATHSSPASSYHSQSPSSPHSGCVAELKARGLWTDAQKKKRGKLSCSECGKFKQSEKYDHLADLAKHMDKSHRDLSHRLKCPQPDCAWGVIGFVSLTEQKRHIKHIHEAQPIECEICFRKLQRQDGYIRHMRDVHNVTAPKTDKLPHRKTKKGGR